MAGRSTKSISSQVERGFGALSIAGREDVDQRSGEAAESRVVDLAVERARRRWASEGRAPRSGRIPKDRLIAELAALQYGVVARRQLLAMEIGAGAIETRLRQHYLHPLHRGVYAVGHLALVALAREMAATLAAGPGAVVSHRSAAAVWHLLRQQDEGAVDILIPRSGRGTRPGLRVHRSKLLSKRDVRHLRGLAVTSPVRTLIDLTEAATDRELDRATHEALARNLTNVRELLREMERFRGRRGLTRLRSLIDAADHPMLTRSEAEERFLALVRAGELPAPEVNVLVEGYEVDFLWREQGVVVEMDGFRFHSSRQAFERDRRRDADLQASGLSVLRFTWRQVVNEPHATIARTARALVR
jgi:very-short-patch-repair endonuclease